MLGRVKLDNTLLTRDQGNFNQITARIRNRTLVTVVRDTCTTAVSLAPTENLLSHNKVTQSECFYFRIIHTVKRANFMITKFFPPLVHGRLVLKANLSKLLLMQRS